MLRKYVLNVAQSVSALSFTVSGILLQCKLPTPIVSFMRTMDFEVNPAVAR